MIYRDGEGVPQDFAEAVKWFRLAGKSSGRIFPNSKAIDFAIDPANPLSIAGSSKGKIRAWLIWLRSLLKTRISKGHCMKPQNECSVQPDVRASGTFKKLTSGQERAPGLALTRQKPKAPVAQGIEHSFPKAGVAGSIPAGGAFWFHNHQDLG